MRRHVAILALLALATCGCSKSKSSPTAPVVPQPPAQGTPLGPAGAFLDGNRFLWSAATNEIVGTGGAGSLALLAMNGTTGATRVIDSETGLAPVASAAGTQVYYQAFVPDPTYGSDDSVAFRRVLLAGGQPARLDARSLSSTFSVYFYAISGDGAWLAWASAAGITPVADSMVIEQTATGTRIRVGPGFPVLMSPDGASLLFRTDLGASLQQRPIASAGVPFDLALPAGASLAGMRWDAAGVHALYLLPPQELHVRHAAAGTSELLYSASASLVASSGTWSPDGARVALWSDVAAIGRPEHTFSLHVVNVATKSGTVVASGTVSASGPFPLEPGAIVFSPDSKRIAYMFGDQVYTSAVPGAAAASSAPVSLAGGQALASSTEISIPGLRARLRR